MLRPLALAISDQLLRQVLRGGLRQVTVIHLPLRELS